MTLHVDRVREKHHAQTRVIKKAYVTLRK